MAYWLTRDNFPGARYDLWKGYPTPGAELWGSRGGLFLGSFLVRRFKEISSSHLEPGKIRKVKSINIVLEAPND